MKLNAQEFIINPAAMVIELVDVHGWTLAGAKAKYKKLTGITITARSKDELVSKLRRECD